MNLLPPQPSHLGLTWQYRVERLATAGAGNRHVVQVTSRARPGHRRLAVQVSTSAGGRGVLPGGAPLIVYVGVRLGGRAVRGARVTCVVEGRGRGGLPLPPTTLQLRDSGAGDPDTTAGDGVYSKYFAALASAGRYSLRVTVEGEGAAHTLGHLAANGSRSRQELGRFTRIVDGDSFLVTDFPADWSAAAIPPCRVVDLGVQVVTSSQQLELSWTAPGADYDEGRPTSYQLYQATSPSQLGAKPLPSTTPPLPSSPLPSSPLPSALLLESFSAVRPAGGREVHRVRVNQDQVNMNLFYVLIAADMEGNLGQVSNVVKAYMPRPLLVGHPPRDNSPLREGLFDPMRTPNEPNIIVMYIIAGIAAIIIFTFLVIVIVICLLKKKTRFGSDVSSEQLHPETVSKRGSLYNGFSVDEFDTEKINQLNYYNSLRQTKGGEAAESGTIQRNLDYCTADLAAYREVPGQPADPTYARPLPRAQRPARPAAAGSPLTVSERTASSPAGSSEGAHTYESLGELAREQQHEPIYRSILKKVPPPTLPKSVVDLDVTVTPRPPDLVTVLDLIPPSPCTTPSLPSLTSPSSPSPSRASDLSPTDKRVRSCTQV